MVQKGTPYGHPIFAALHAEVFFKLSCLSGTYILITSPTRLRVVTLANMKSPRWCWSWLLPQWAPTFICSLLNANNTTQVHAALLEWADGYYQPTEFLYNRCSDIYDLHLKTLKSIFEFNIHGFHCTLSDLYQDTTWVISQPPFPISCSKYLIYQWSRFHCTHRGLWCWLLHYADLVTSTSLEEWTSTLISLASLIT